MTQSNHTLIAYSNSEQLAELISMIYASNCSEDAHIVGVSSHSELSDALRCGGTLIPHNQVC